jgi:glyoxylase-like metal-dependent hydrolase (beta-lactamase superfamily II)
MTVIAKDGRVQIERLQLGPFGTNTYIMTSQKTKEGVIFDAPADPSKVLERVEDMTVRYILMTHGHMDHTGALTELKATLGVPVAAHAGDSGSLPQPPDMLLEDGQTLSFGDVQLKVLHTPGHTPGSVCFLTDAHLVSGDTLFPGGPGKTWSAADFEQILDSIKSKILPLSDDTNVYPGHGDATTLKIERQAIEAFCTKPHDGNLYGDVVWSMA